MNQQPQKRVQLDDEPERGNLADHYKRHEVKYLSGGLLLVGLWTLLEWGPKFGWF